MVWSFQLTPWALAAVLAHLLLAREWAFFGPRWRERGSVALLTLSGITGVWATLQLASMAIPRVEPALGLFQAQLAVGALAPVAWVAFCLQVTDRGQALLRPAAFLLYLLSWGTVILAVQAPERAMVLEGVRMAVQESGYRGLVVDPGPWYWVHVLVRSVAVAVGGTIVVRYLWEYPTTRGWAALPGLATVVVLAPGIAQGLAGEVRVWQDLSAPSFAVAVSLLALGVMRHQLLDLGPVARTLVMLELRDPLMVLDGRGRIVDLNRAAERTFGLRVYGDLPPDFHGLRSSVRAAADRYAEVVLPVQEAPGAPGGEASASGVPEAPRRTFEVTVTPLGRNDPSGQTALLFRDVTERRRMERELLDTTSELRQANEELERLANTDALTGLANRRRFMRRLERELDRSQRYDRPLSLILLDLDGFKQVNDVHGHAVGDAVLEATAEVMRSVCREVDVPARLGGEELALLVPETGMDGALALAERLRARLQERTHLDEEGMPFTVTASLGVATRGAGGRGSPDALLHRADMALYDAKNGGRNRVVVSSA
jgi:diguanylate cyclase (GGDEF)-like protein